MNLDTCLKTNERHLIDATCEIIKIKSVKGEPLPGMPFGEGPARALNYALDLAKTQGFETVNLDNYVGWAEWGQGDETIGILVHLDVVPEGRGWTYPPYGAEIHNGKIFGRGAFDDKGPAMAALFALKTLKDAEIQFSRKVRVIFGTDEESGMEDIEYYLKHAEMPDMSFSPDAEYPIINGEKGILTFKIAKNFGSIKTSPAKFKVLSLRGGDRSNMVPDYAEALISGDKEEISHVVAEFTEKTGYDIQIEASEGSVVLKSHGVSAHGSVPDKGKNAVMMLFALLGELDIVDSQQEFISFINEKIGLDTSGKNLGIDFSDEISGPLTLNVGIAEMDERAAGLTINVRYPITIKCKQIMDAVKNKLMNNMELNVISDSPPHYVPEDNLMIQKLKLAYEKVTGEKAYCFTIGGGTYARSFKNAVAFGPKFPGGPDIAHEKDEYIDVEELKKNMRIYAYVLRELVE